MASWRRIVLGTPESSAQPPAASARFLSLIEVRTAKRLCLLTTVAVMVLWGLELQTALLAPYDLWGLPLIAATLMGLYFRLRVHPESLLSCQRIAVGMIIVYFLACGLTAVTDESNLPLPYWTPNNLQWLPVVTLLLHFSYPWGIALRLSLLILLIAAIPAVWLGWLQGASPWQQLSRTMLINAVLMQATFTGCLLVITRLTSGVREIIGGGSEGAADIREGLEQWVNERTRELAQARDTAESASQAKSRFLAVISHELRTPLHAMLVAADLLHEVQTQGPGASADARQRALLSTVQSSGQHLLALIDQVLEMSRIEAGKLEAVEQPIDLAALTHKACAAVRARAELKGLKLMVALPDDLPRMRLGDELRLSQVLINLLANAVKFTQKGHVSLAVRPMKDPPDDSDWLQWSVIDTGPGLTEPEQRHVFEAFYQTQAPREAGGVGLGLTITRELVQLMRGQIHLRSQPGAGTRIDVCLPMPVLQDAIAMPPHQPEPLPDLSGLLALVVDDDLVNRMLAVEMLSAAGIAVIEAESGAEALDQVHHHRPDIVLMDWQMPGMDGLEATRLIRDGVAGQDMQDVPVLGLTANAFDEDRHTCLAAGMNNVLTKPVTREVLLAELAFWAPANFGREQAKRA